MKATVIKLSEPTRDFFKKLSFPEIPKEANFIAFTEDGDALFLEELETPGVYAMPKFMFMSYYDVEDLSVE